MSYKHGVYGNTAETYEATSTSQGTIPAYIGSAPIHRINSNGKSDFDYSDYINKPILLSSLRQARELGLYSDDWKTYTLCEAIHAHFMNGENSVAPIVLINVLDPKTHIKAEAVTAEVTMKKVGTKFTGYIEDPLCSIADIALSINETAGVSEPKTTYYYSGDKVVIESEVTLAEGKENTISFTATATYKQIEFAAEKFDADTVQKALDCLDYSEQLIGLTPNTLAAPGITEIPTLHALMIQKAIEKIATKWNFVILSDIPSSQETYDAAKTWKKDNAYESKLEKVYWPSLAYGDKVYHGSVIGSYMMQNIDTSNSDIPYVSTSNKEIFCDRAVVGDNKTLQISEQKANELNQVGITTVNIIKRGLRLWGSHMANYDYETLDSIAPEDRFDVSVRMSMYILNYLQNQYINEIDESFTRKDVDNIVNGVQTWLDSLVNDGMLLSATASFNNESNSDESIANGDFEFDIQVTYSVIAKSITFKLQYTSEGLVTLTTEGGEE